ncbi:M1 family aminopeptidase [Roseibacterium sp. SDUM158017]|uniref:M1 family metallopeptidase n=1 Tax=Roseicyclus salinarum TaxID=3036773 RepID=UPI0024157E24|nr:M1 family aminopeptidase [Roseibacterium sp. SDUM158017]MDG4648134.1 M1 family aminopeptidase [Roseibacterium sp. SDUM158017]
MTPVRHTARAWLLTLACALAIGAALAPVAAAAQTAARADPPDIVLSIEIDTATGAFSAEALLQAPRGDVVLPRADWLRVEGVTLAGRDATRAAREGGGVIGPGLHRSRDLRVTVSGRFPAPRAPIGAVAWSPSATYAVGADWFPRDGTAIRDHDIRVSVARPQEVAATGGVVSEAVDGAMREARFAFTGPSVDVALFVGPYAIGETRHRDLRLRTYFEDADAALSERYLAAVATWLDRYEEAIGDYPHHGFSVVSAPIPVGLGFAGLTYVSRDILSHPYMTGRSLAHEVLHSWWGNAVGVDYATGNWAEGLTTFQADYALAEEAGNGAAREMRIGWVRELARLDAGRMTPLAAFRSASHAGGQSEGYGKAALVFHMLRDEIGAAAFAEGIRGFYAANRNRVAGWGDLRAAFEASSGRDLGWFFDQWIDRAGLPGLRVAEAGWREAPDGAHEVTLTIRQAAPAYRLRLPVVFRTRAGEVRRVAQIEGEVSTLRFTLPDAPRTAVIDPEFDLARQPFEGELAPILRALDAGRVRAVAASPLEGLRAGVEAALAGIAPGLSWGAAQGDAGDRTSVLIAGLPEDVAALRPTHLGPLPGVAAQGRSRLWLERDGQGKLWAFLSFDRLEDLARDFGALRYYTGQSFVAFEDGRAVAGGVWPALPGAVELEFGPAGGEVAP